MALLSSRVTISGATRWENNHARDIGAIFFLYHGSLEKPHFIGDDDMHVFINNTAPMGNDRTLATGVTRLAYSSPIIKSHTSGTLIKPSLTFTAEDYYHNSFTIATPVTVLIVSYDSVVIPNELSIASSSSSSSDERRINDSLLLIDGVTATATPGATRTYRLWWSALEYDGGTVGDATLFQISYRSCHGGEQVSNYKCEACSVGKYSDSTNAQRCDSCAIGSYQSIEGQTSCHKCARGSWQPSIAQANCLTCSPGM
jgi:hypothetical protein